MGLVSYSLDGEARSPIELQNRFHYDTSDDRIIMERVQDVTPILNSNVEKQNTGDGYTKDRSMRLVARIPLVVVDKIMKEQGWNPMLPENKGRLLQLLDDPEYAYLRTVDKSVTLARAPRREYFRASTAVVKPVYAGDE